MLLLGLGIGVLDLELDSGSIRRDSDCIDDLHLEISILFAIK